jgi:imidazolonepropionase-like amidohydrolase
MHPIRRSSGTVAALLAAASLAATGLAAAQGTAASTGGRPAGAVAITHATLIDGRGGEPVADATIVFDAGRIVAAGPSARVPVPRGARTIDGRGRFVIPGLWDMHVHAALAPVSPRALGTNDLTSNRDYFFPLLLANGVTGVRDMAGDLAALKQWRSAIARGELAGPRMVMTGRKLGDRAVVPGAPFPVLTDADARASVRALRQAGADFVKLGNLPPALLSAVADESRRQHIPFLGHVPAGVSARTAALAGQRSIEHLTGIGLAASTREEEIREREEIQTFPTVWHRIALRLHLTETMDTQWAIQTSYSPQKAAALAALFAQHDTWQTPTLRLLGTLLRAPGGDVGVGPREFSIDPVPEDSVWWHVAPPTRARFDALYGNTKAVVGLMHQAHVPFLAGTDTPTAFAIPGFSLHDELARFVVAGFTPMEALQAATRGPALFLGALDSLGTVEPGKRADLLLLDADPLADIHNTRRIRAVVADGRVYDRQQLDGMVAAVAARAAAWRKEPRPANP